MKSGKRANAVYDIFMDCLLKESEIKDDLPTLEMVDKFIVTYCLPGRFVTFHKERLHNHRKEIRECIKDIGAVSQKSKGFSFVEMPLDKYGVQWCEQPTAGMLLALGVALGDLKMSPKLLWVVTYGVPYVEYIPLSEVPERIEKIKRLIQAIQSDDYETDPDANMDDLIKVQERKLAFENWRLAFENNPLIERPELDNDTRKVQEETIKNVRKANSVNGADE